MRYLVLLSVLLGGCGWDLGFPRRPVDKPTFTIQNDFATIKVYDFRASQDKPVDHFQERLTNIIEQSLKYWEANWSDLDGYTIEYVDDNIVCGGEDQVNGCTIQFNKTIVIWANSNCIEYFALPHELGHATAFFGDPLHHSSKFRHVGDLIGPIISLNVPLATDGCAEQLERNPETVGWNKPFGF